MSKTYTLVPSYQQLFDQWKTARENAYKNGLNTSNYIDPNAQYPTWNESAAQQVPGFERDKFEDYVPFIDIDTKGVAGLEEERANNQSAGERIWHGVERVAGGTAIKIGQGAGYLGGLAVALPAWDLSVAYDNALVNTMDNLDEQMKEALPVFQTRKYQNMNWWERLGTSTFWASDGADAIAFLASAYLTGLGVGQVAKVVGLGAKILDQSAKLSNVATKKMMQYLGKNIDMAMITGINTSNEALFEAADGYKTGTEESARMLENYSAQLDAAQAKDLQEFDEQYQPDPSNPAYEEHRQLARQQITEKYLSDYNSKAAELKQTVAKGAQARYVANLAALMGPNSIQTMMLFGKGRAGARTLKTLEETGGKVSTGTQIAKNVAIGALSEGPWEENVQLAIQKYEQRRSLEGTDQKRLEGYAKGMLDNVDLMTKGDPEAGASIFLGSFMGALGGIRGGIQDAKATRDKYAKWKKLLSDSDIELPENFRSFLKEREVTDPDGKTHKTFFSDDGKLTYEVDPQKALKLAYQTVQDFDIFDEGLAAATKGDELHARMNSAVAVARDFWKYKQMEDGIDVLKERVRMYQEKHKEQNPTDLSAESIWSEYMDMLDTYEKMYDKTMVQANQVKLDNSAEAAMFRNQLQKTLFLQGVRTTGLENMNKAMSEKISEFDTQHAHRIATLEAKKNGQTITADETKELNDLIAERTRLNNVVEGIHTLVDESVQNVDSLLKEGKNIYTDIRKQAESLVNNKIRVKQITELEKAGKATEENKQEKARLEFELAENQAIEGETNRFTINENEATTENSKGRVDLKEGLRRKFNYELGYDAMVQDDIDKQLRTAKTPEDIIDQIAKKKNLTEENLALLKAVVRSYSPSLVDEKDNSLGEYDQHVKTRDVEDQKIDEAMASANRKVFSEQVKNGELEEGADPADNETFFYGEDFVDRADRLIEQYPFLKDELDTAKQAREKRNAAQAEVDRRGVIKAKYENLLAQDAKFKKERTQREDAIKDGNIDTYLRLQFARQFLAPVVDVLRAYTRNEKIYANAAEASRALTSARTLKNTYKNRTEDTDSLIFSRGIFSNEDLTNMGLQSKQMTFMEELDAIIDRLETAVKDASDNMEKDVVVQQQTFQDEGQENTSMIGVTVNPLTNEESEQDGLTALFKLVLGDQLWDQIRADLKEYGYDSIIATTAIQLFKEKANTHQKTQLAKLIKDLKGELYSSIIKAVPTPTYDKLYQKNPDKFLFALLSTNPEYRPGREYQSAADTDLANKESSLNMLNNTHNVTKFIREAKSKHDQGIDEFGDFYDRFMTAAQLHIQYSALVHLEALLDSQTDVVNDLSREVSLIEELKAAGSPVLSLEQTYAIRSIKEMLGSKSQHMSFLKGVAGTGKTAFVLRYLMKLAGLTKNDVIATGHTPYSAKTVASALSTDVTYFQSLLTAPIADNVKLLIVDEAPGISTESLEALIDRVQALNKTRTTPLKILFLGDPAQITPNPEMQTPFEIGFGRFESIRPIRPLTMRFRSDVGVVNTVAETFRGNPSKVSSIAGSSNVEHGNIPAEALGVQTSLSKDEGISILKNQQKSNKRSRIIVVATEAQKAQYAHLADAQTEVLTYIEAQSATVDEVYVMFESSDSPLFANVSYFNTAMYTAVSRAKKFVFIPIAGETQYNSKITDTDSQNKIVNNKGLLVLNQTLTNEVGMVATYTGKKVMPEKKSPEQQEPAKDVENPIKTTDEDDTATQDPEVPEEQDEPTEEIPERPDDLTQPGVTVKARGAIMHNLRAPTYDSLANKSRENGVKSARVKPGAKVIYVRTFDDNGNSYIRILAQEDAPEGKHGETTWAEIGVLTDEEKDTTELGMMLAERNAKAEKERRGVKLITTTDKNSGTLTPEELSSSAVLYEGKLAYASPLKYQYTKETQHKGKGLIDHLSNVFRPFFKGDVNQEGSIKQHLSIKIFTRKESAQLQTNTMRLYPGVPYLVYTSSGTSSPVTQYIRLSPRKLRETDRVVELSRKAIGLVESIEKKIGDPTFTIGTERFNRIARQFQKDLVIDNRTGEITLQKPENQLTWSRLDEDTETKVAQSMITEEQFNAVKDDMRELVRLYYGPKRTRVLFTAEEATKEFDDDTHVFIPISGTDKGIVRNLTDTAEDPAGAQVSHFTLERGYGELQRELNKLAAANRYIAGVSFITGRKAVSHSSDKSKRSVYKLREAKGLLADASEENTTEASNRKYIGVIRHLLVKEKGIALPAGVDLETIETLLMTDGGVTREELDELRRDTASNPITKKMLSDIASMVDGEHSAADENGVPYYLRYPLSISRVNELGAKLNDQASREELEDMLTDKLEKVIPTEVVVECPVKESNESTDQQDPTRTEIKPKEQQEEIPEWFKRVRQKGARRTMQESPENIGTPVSRTKVLKALEKILGKHNLDVEFVQRAVLQAMEHPGEKNLVGLMDNGKLFLIDENGETSLIVARHEAFHKVFNYLMTESERANLVKSLLIRYPEHAGKPIEEIEEVLARMFQQHYSGKATFIGRVHYWFKKIAAFFHLCELEHDAIKGIFDTIDRGDYSKARSSKPVDGLRRTMVQIKKNWGSAEMYKRAKAMVQNLVEDFILYGLDGTEEHYGIPLTPDEIIDESLLRLMDSSKYLQQMLDSTPEGAEHDELEADLRAHKLLLTVKNGRPALFHEMLKGMYPQWTFGKVGFVPMEEEDVEEEETAGSAFHEAHIEENENKNLEKKLSTEVKNFLSNVRTKDGIRMNPRAVYLKMARLVMHLDPSDPEFTAQLQSVWNHSGKDKYSTAIYMTFKNLVGTANMKVNHGVELPTNAMFLMDDKSDNQVFAIATDGRDISGMTLRELEMNGDVMIMRRDDLKKDRHGRRSTKAFIDQIIKTHPEMSQDTLIDLLRKANAQEVLRQVFTLFGSMRERTLFIGNTEYSYGYPMVFYRHRAASGAEMNFQAIVSDMFSAHPDVVKAFFKDKAFQLKTTDAKRQALMNFIKDIGLPVTSLDVIEDGVVEVLYNKLNILAGKVKEMLGTEIKQKTITEPDETTSTEQPEAGYDPSRDEISYTPDEKRVYTMPMILGQQHSTINEFASILSATTDNDRAASVKAASGKSSYLLNNSSNGLRSLQYLVDRFVRKYNIPLPEFMTTDFYQKNPFVQGKLNKIYRIVDHDAMVRGDFITEYSKMNDREWFTYAFNTAFVGYMINNTASEGDVTQYAQTMYTMDRGRAFEVSVDALNQEKQREMLRSILEQMTLRVDMSNVAGYNRLSTINFRILNSAAKNKSTDAATFLKDPIAENITDKLIDDLMLELEDRVVNFAKNYVRNKVALPGNLAEATKRLIRTKVIDTARTTNYGHTGKPLDFSLAQFSGQVRSVDKKQYMTTVEQILPIMDAFVKNTYLNGYFANQLAIGDYAGFPSSSKLIKRIDAAYAPGQIGLVHDLFGMKKKYTCLIVKGQKLAQYSDVFKAFSVFNIEYDPNDGQGFMLPERAEEIERGFGKPYGVGGVFKPAHYEHVVKEENGKKIPVTVMNKYSSILLSDEICQAFPQLQTMRDNMRANKIMEVVFDTATKVGALKTGPNADQLFTPNMEIAPEQIYQLSNANYRMQFNPMHDIDVKVKNPSQLTNFLNILEDKMNQENTQKIYSTIARLIHMHLAKMQNKLSSQAKIEQALREASASGDGNIMDFIDSGISMNFPTIVEKVFPSLMSKIESGVTKIQFSGSKLVLQSNFGIQLTENMPGATERLSKDVLDQAGRLQYKETTINGEKRIYAEAILPEMYRDMVKTGDFLYGDALGFRIPSSELHCAVPLKVVGYYPTKNSNVIIVPSEIVSLHGSDYDVDSLFVIHRRQFSGNVYRNEELNDDMVKKMLDEAESLLHQAEIDTDPVSRQEALDLADAMISLASSEQTKASQDTVLSSEDLEYKYQQYLEQTNTTDDIKTRRSWARENGTSYDDETKQFAETTTGENAAAKARGLALYAARHTKNARIIDTATTIFNLLKYTSPVFRQDAPIGYKKQNGNWVLDENFEQTLQEIRDRAPEKDHDKLDKILEDYLMNTIVEGMLEFVTAERNRERMFTPISMDRFNEKGNDQGKTYKQGTILRMLEDLGVSADGDLDLSDPSDNQRAHRLVFDSADLVGAIASPMKGLSAIVKAGVTPELQEAFLAAQSAMQQAQLAIKKIKEDLEDKSKTQEEIDALKEQLTQVQATLVEAKGRAQKAAQEGFAGTPLLQGSDRGTDSARTIQLNGVKYDRICETERTKHGFDTTHTLWQTLDSMMNAAIDNLKEQILGILNLTSSTIGPMIAGLSLGIPLDTMTRIMRQPVLLKFTSIGQFNRAYNDLMAELAGDMTDAQKKSLREMDVTDAQLDTLIRKYPYGTDDLTALTDEEKTVQISLLLKFRTMQDLSEDIAMVSRLVSATRTIPAFPEKLDSLMEDIDKVTSEEQGDKGVLAFQTPNLRRAVPHVFEALNVVKFAHNLAETYIHKYSSAIKQFVGDLNINLRLAHGAENISMLATEFQKYLTAAVVKQDWRIPYVAPKDAGGTTRLFGAKAFSQHMCQMVKAVKALPEIKGSNFFMDRLQVVESTHASGFYHLEFFLGRNPETEDILDAQEAFDQLRHITIERPNNTWVAKWNAVAPDKPSNFQQNLIAYGALNFGLGFGVSNFSRGISPTLYKTLDNDLNAAFQQLKTDPSKFELLKEHFELFMAYNHSDKLPFFRIPGQDVKPLVCGTYKSKFGQPGKIRSGEINKMYFDLAFPLPEGYDVNHLEKYIQHSSAKDAYVHTGIAKQNGTLYACYQKIGHSPKAAYDPKANLLTERYATEIAFDPYVATVFTADPQATSHFARTEVEESENGEAKPYIPKIGDIIELVGYNDPARLSKRRAKVTYVEENSISVMDAPTPKVVDVKGTSLKTTQTKSPLLDSAKAGDSFTIEEAAESLILDNLSSSLFTVIKPFLTVSKRVQIVKSIKPSHPERIDSEGPIGTRSSDGIIEIVASDSLTKRNIGTTTGTILLHELVHDATAEVLEKGSQNLAYLMPEQQRAFKEIHDIYTAVKQRDILQHYGITSIHEFIAETFSNPEFQRLLDSMQYTKKKTVFEAIVDGIAAFFGITPESALHYTIESTIRLLSATEDMAALSAVLTENGMSIKSGSVEDVKNALLERGLISSNC